MAVRRPPLLPGPSAMPMNYRRSSSLVVLFLLAGRVRAEEPPPEQVRFFETRVRPILATHCQKCHGAKKQRGDLRLDSREAVLRGGDSGPAAVVGEPDRSLLL